MKRPKRRTTNKGQYFLFEEMIVSAKKSEKPIIEIHNNLLTKYDTKIVDSTEVGLETNKIYCGDTVETMGKINGTLQHCNLLKNY